MSDSVLLVMVGEESKKEELSRQESCRPSAGGEQADKLWIGRWELLLLFQQVESINHSMTAHVAFAGIL